ncbi:MAG: BRO family protein [Saprospiraceae bacterium]|nr:BRO family protein [Saprospiraceae bacterium]
MEQNNKLVLFEEKPIRRVEHEGEIYLSVIDVIAALTDSANPNVYWSALKKREPQLFTICKKLKMPSADGKNRLSDMANTEGVLRLIMSVPSPQAEPFKQWLAAVGKQALDETENPELLTERQAELYRAKGYTEEWIKRRVQSIETRKELTDEWQQRGVKEGQEYAILTATIAKGTFGLTPTEHKEIKKLDRQNLRDHMTPLELILTAFGEEVTRQITIQDDAQGFNENHEAAQRGGNVAGQARYNAETELGTKVVSSDNYLNLKADNAPNKELNQSE